MRTYSYLQEGHVRVVGGWVDRWMGEWVGGWMKHRREHVTASLETRRRQPRQRLERGEGEGGGGQ